MTTVQPYPQAGHPIASRAKRKPAKALVWYWLDHNPGRHFWVTEVEKELGLTREQVLRSIRQYANANKPKLAVLLDHHEYCVPNHDVPPASDPPIDQIVPELPDVPVIQVHPEAYLPLGMTLEITYDKSGIKLAETDKGQTIRIIVVAE